METVFIPEDITVYYVPAKSFPAGVLQAHEHLHSLVPYTRQRQYYGISRPESGSIHYKAAATELQAGDLQRHGLNQFVIKKGKYISLLVKDFKVDISSIGNAFDKLTHVAGIDPEGYCVEQYVGLNDVICMIRLSE